MGAHNLTRFIAANAFSVQEGREYVVSNSRFACLRIAIRQEVSA